MANPYLDNMPYMAYNIIKERSVHMWEVELYSTSDGKEVVADFLDSLPIKHRAKAMWEIELLSQYGTKLSQPYVKHIEKDLWELRIKSASDISRIFYFIPLKNKIILLHGFIKKTDKTPAAEKDVANKRMIDYKERCMK